MMNQEPVSTTSGAAPLAEADVPFNVWQCILCGFIYDESAGLPEEGIAPGTRWADVPDDWICPDCSATKADFEMIEI
jgi:rubredoxin